MTTAPDTPVSLSEVRVATAADLDAIVAIERSVFGDPWTRRSFEHLLGEDQVVFVVASDGRRVAGYAVALVAPPESELANLAVDVAAQRRGVGRHLLHAVIDAVRARGCGTMWLEVRESNLAAIRLYEVARFQRVGRRKRYYVSPVEDAIVMRGDLGT